MCDPVVQFGPNANKVAVSAHTLEVLTTILKQASADTCRITSTSRTPAGQARVMYNNLLRDGVARQKELYRAPGKAVIDAYVAAGGKAGDRAKVRAAMEAEIRKQGPSRVSRHCADPTVLNVVDVAPSSVAAARRDAFVRAVEAAKGTGLVSKFLSPSNSSDPAFHIEVPQPVPAEEPEPAPAPAAGTGGGIPRVSIITRSEWGARAPTGSLRGLVDASSIVVHHTAQGFSEAARAGCSSATGRQAIRTIQSGHLRRRFSDVGYHFVIDGAGRVYQGRSYQRPGSFGPGRRPPRLSLGAHVGGQNSRRIGVNVVGCFGAGPGEADCGDAPSEKALETLARLVAALSAAYGIPLTPGSVVGHKDLAATACPGTRLHAELPGIRARAAAVLA